MRRNEVKTEITYIKLHISLFIRQNFYRTLNVFLSDTSYVELRKNLVTSFKGTLASCC